MTEKEYLAEQQPSVKIYIPRLFEFSIWIRVFETSKWYEIRSQVRTRSRLLCLSANCQGIPIRQFNCCALYKRREEKRFHFYFIPSRINILTSFFFFQDFQLSLRKYSWIFSVAIQLSNNEEKEWTNGFSKMFSKRRPTNWHGRLRTKAIFWGDLLAIYESRRRQYTL